MELGGLDGSEGSAKFLFVDSIEGEDDLFIVLDGFLGVCQHFGNGRVDF